MHFAEKIAPDQRPYVCQGFSIRVEEKQKDVAVSFKECLDLIGMLGDCACQGGAGQ